jgi:soluble P-type ATPase
MSVIDEYLRFIATKVSFDYDGVLSTEKGKELARQKISDGNTVYIISARGSKDGMLNTAKDLGIPESRIYATGSNKAKIEKIKELNITTHYDNNPDVIAELGNVGKLFTNG